MFQQVVGCNVADSFFSDHYIRLPFNDLLTHISHFVHLLLESVSHVGFLAHFHASLTLSFFVFEGRVQQQYSWVSDFLSHFGMD